MVDTSVVLPQPPGNARVYHNVSMWLDEQIWGHRLLDDQSPWLLFLEFLNVAESNHRDQRLLDERGEYNRVVYKPYWRVYLRNILFNSEALLQIAERRPDNASAWSEWIARMEDDYRGSGRAEFSYLKDRFHSFQQFAALVRMIRGSVVESDSNKRWSSRFVFPFGPHALYEDLNIWPNPSKQPSREYIYFGRTGELLYLMLSRSALAAELRPHLSTLFERKNQWDRLLERFQPDGPEPYPERGEGFLPYRSCPRFDLLAEDWLAVLRLGLPGFDAYQYLVVLGALHVMLYQLGKGAEWCEQEGSVPLVCEVVAPKKTIVRELSALSYQQNNQLTQRAIERFIDHIEESDEWRRAAAQPGAFVACRNLLLEKVRWPKTKEDGESDYEGPPDPEPLIAELRRAAISRHRQNLANVHRNYGREVGLVSRRGTNTLRYAPTDSLLKALVLSNVENRMEFKEFLARILDRYGLVIGDREAERVLEREDFDRDAFQKNAQRLEQRLSSLGVLRRLSDACAYVQNPFRRRTM